jgi:hypothetical protein
MSRKTNPSDNDPEGLEGAPAPRNNGCVQPHEKCDAAGVDVSAGQGQGAGSGVRDLKRTQAARAKRSRAAIEALARMALEEVALTAHLHGYGLGQMDQLQWARFGAALGGPDAPAASFRLKLGSKMVEICDAEALTPPLR